MSLNTAVKDYGSNQAAAGTAAEPSSIPDFNRIRHTVNEDTQRIRRNNTQMQKLVSQIGGPNDNLELRDKVHKLQHQTNELAKETNKSIQLLVTLPLSSINAKQQKQIREQLTNEFTTALKDFQSLQRSQMNEEKNALMRKKKISSEQQMLDSQASETEKYDSSGEHLFGPVSEQRLQISKESDDLDQLQETEGQLRKLEADISDINQVFRDLSLIIHQQAEFVDSIEANTESASINVSRGTEELLKARQYRDKIRRRKCILISVVTVTIAVVILIIVISASR